MKNRAKCRLCQTLIESFFERDFITCKCGEISVFGGDGMHTKAKDYANFLRVDEMGNEIPVKYVSVHEDEKSNGQPTDAPKEFSKAELIEELETFIKNDLQLPDDAHIQHISFVDLLRYMVPILSILKKL